MPTHGSEQAAKKVISRDAQIVSIAPHANSSVAVAGEREKCPSSLFASLKTVLIPFACSRFIFALILFGAACFSVEKTAAREGLNYDLIVASDLTSGLQVARRILYSADGFWYIDLALHGYDRVPFAPTPAHNWVFFPLYSALVGLVGGLCTKYLTAALAINFFSFWCGLAFLHQLALLHGYSQQESVRAIWVAALFPTSLYFSMPVSEALFFFLLTGSYYLLKRGQISGAGAGMMFASVCRPTGLLLYPAFLAALLEERSATVRNSRGKALVLAAAIAPLGAIGFIFYLYSICGNPFAFIDNQVSWGRHIQPNDSLAALVQEIRGSVVKPWNFVLLNLGYVGLAVAAACHFLRRRKIDFALIIAIPLLAALSTGTLTSIGRYVATLFPVYLWIAGSIRSEAIERGVLVILTALYVLYCVGYVLHVTPAMA